jgi:hypothetical protein
MKIPEIKRLIENYSIEELKLGEESLLNEDLPEIEIKGEDEGEQLTHVMAAIWCKEYIKQNGSEIKNAIREYTIKVRSSIS